MDGNTVFEICSGFQSWLQNEWYEQTKEMEDGLDDENDFGQCSGTRMVNAGISKREECTGWRTEDAKRDVSCFSYNGGVVKSGIQFIKVFGHNFLDMYW